MLSLLLSAATENAPIFFENLNLKPYLFRIGGFELRWYSLAYLAGIVIGFWHLSKMLKAPGAPLAQRHSDDLFFWCTLGIILGGRLGYATFYTGGDTGLPSLWSDPAELLKLWNGGMSFHGGLVGRAAGNRLGRLARRAVLPAGLRLHCGRGADRHAVRAARQLRQRRAVGPRGRRPPCPGRWSFPRMPDSSPATPASCIRPGWKGCCCSRSCSRCSGKPARAGGRGCWSGCSRWAWAWPGSSSSIYREPDSQLASFAARTGLSMGQWLTLPLIAVGLFFMIRALMRPALGSTTPPVQ